MELPAIIEQIVFHSIEENLDLAIQKTMNLFDTNFPYSFNLIICNLIYSLFYSKKNEVEIYLNYLEIIQIKEQELNNSKIIEVFAKYLSKIKTQEAFYLIEKMIELKLIDSNITKNIKSIYFAHYKTKKENKKKYFNDLFCKPFLKNIEELSKNDWELHKQLIKEGVNPNEIAKIIRNDEIEKLQEISSQSNFDFNQSIEPSLYERYDFINQKNVTLIDYSAFFSSVKCFKYLLVNGANVENTGKYAIAGGNEEIIHLCEQNHSSFEAACETAIKFHRNDIFKYFYEKNIENKLEKANKLINVCSNYGNYEIFSFLKDKKIKIRHKFINDLARNGNLYLIKCLFHKDQYPKNILISSIESENIELVKFILEQKCIDINTKNIYLFYTIFYINNLDLKNNFWSLLNLLKTPLMFASIFGYTEVVKLLLQQEGININAKNIN